MNPGPTAPGPAAPGPAAPRAVRAALLEDFSLEMTGKDVPQLEEARHLIPPGTRINVTFLGNEDLGTRLAAARAVKRLGFLPVPHLAARRIGSRAELEEFLAGLRADGTGERVFVVGGDPARPHGPYEDALAVIRTGLLERHGVRHVGISGYPEGHPAITDRVLWAALADKSAALAGKGLGGQVVTQFGFDVDPVVRRPRAGHLGLRLLADRATAAGATLAVRTAPGAGTSLRLEVPTP